MNIKIKPRSQQLNSKQIKPKKKISYQMKFATAVELGPRYPHV